MTSKSCSPKGDKYHPANTSPRIVPATVNMGTMSSAGKKVYFKRLWMQDVLELPVASSKHNHSPRRTNAPFQRSLASQLMDVSSHRHLRLCARFLYSIDLTNDLGLTSIPGMAM